MLMLTLTEANVYDAPVPTRIGACFKQGSPLEPAGNANIGCSFLRLPDLDSGAHPPNPTNATVVIGFRGAGHPAVLLCHHLGEANVEITDLPRRTGQESGGSCSC